MSEPVTVRKSDIEVQHAWVTTSDIIGLTLGDLRALVEAAYELPDSALVTTERIKPSVRYVDEFYLFALHARDEIVQ